MLDFVEEVITKPAIISAFRTTIIAQFGMFVNVSLLNASAHAVVHVTMLPTVSGHVIIKFVIFLESFTVKQQATIEI